MAYEIEYGLRLMAVCLFAFLLGFGVGGLFKFTRQIFEKSIH